ncbi:hypothetical protein EV359DRAFT_83250 [Lentinula novae-zelandiae]|nr:hypothetical protein EV359DRAFT_83250 [Lentinula novae-zelandiae]
MQMESSLPVDGKRMLHQDKERGRGRPGQTRLRTHTKRSQKQLGFDSSVRDGTKSQNLDGTLLLEVRAEARPLAGVVQGIVDGMLLLPESPGAKSLKRTKLGLWTLENGQKNNFDLTEIGTPERNLGWLATYKKISAHQAQYNADNDLWEANRMLTSSVATRKTADVDLEDESESTVHVMIHDLKPPFLDGRTVYTKQLVPANTSVSTSW